MKIYDLFYRIYFQLYIFYDVFRFVNGCYFYKQTKQSQLQSLKFFQPLPILFHLWTDILVDYIGPFFDLVYYKRIYNYILIIVDRFIKIYHFVFISNISVTTLIDIFILKIYRLYGISIFIVLNYRTQFVFIFWKEFNQRLDIILKHSSIVYLEING